MAAVKNLYNKLMDINKINLLLKANAEETYCKFSSALVPNCRMLGVRLPILRKIAKDISAQDWQYYFLNSPEDYLEQVMLKGFLLGYIKDIGLLLKYLKLYIHKINNWSVCDSPLSSLKLIKKHQKEVWLFLQPYLKDNREFYGRSAACLLMDYFIDETYIKNTLEALSKIKAQGYYSKMGVAWALSVCYVKFPEETEFYFRENIFDIETHNKAIDKINDSLRVSRQAKDRLKTLKRK